MGDLRRGFGLRASGESSGRAARMARKLEIVKGVNAKLIATRWGVAKGDALTGAKWDAEEHLVGNPLW